MVTFWVSGVLSRDVHECFAQCFYICFKVPLPDALQSLLRDGQSLLRIFESAFDGMPERIDIADWIDVAGDSVFDEVCGCAYIG